MEACIEFSKVLNIVKFTAALSKKRETTDWRTGNRDVPQANQNQVSLTAAKSDGGFFFFLLLLKDVLIYWSLHSDVSMISHFNRGDSRSFMSWTSIFVPLLDTDDL